MDFHKISKLHVSTQREFYCVTKSGNRVEATRFSHSHPAFWKMYVRSMVICMIAAAILVAESPTVVHQKPYDEQDPSASLA